MAGATRNPTQQIDAMSWMPTPGNVDEPQMKARRLPGHHTASTCYNNTQWQMVRTQFILYYRVFGFGEWVQTGSETGGQERIS